MEAQRADALSALRGGRTGAQALLGAQHGRLARHGAGPAHGSPPRAGAPGAGRPYPLAGDAERGRLAPRSGQYQGDRPHGRVDTVCCLGCAARSPRLLLQEELSRRNPHWAALHARTAPDGDADLDRRDFAQFELPTCAHCGGMLKPDVVFFGENVPRERVAAVRAALAEADALLVAGSSLMVYSGYRFVEDAVAAGKPVAAVNIGRTRADAVLTLKVEREVGAALAALASRCWQPAPWPVKPPRLLTPPAKCRAI